MRDFRQSNRNDRRFGGRPSSFEGRSRFNRDRDSDRGRPQMHDVECSKCGKSCQVPFRPTGERPVFCSECFRPEGDMRPAFKSRNAGATTLQSNASADQLKQINTKLDKILVILNELEMVGEDENEDDVPEDNEEDSDETDEEVA